MLSPELLVMILKAFHKSSPESLPELRLVTKQFDSIIVPITYNHITPTPKLIQCVSNNRESSVHLVAEWRVTQDICRYTRHIAIKELLDWEVVDILLRRLRELKTFTWLYRSTAFRSPAFEPVAETLIKMWPCAGYRLEGVKGRTLKKYAKWQFYHLRGGSLKEMDWVMRVSNQLGNPIL